MKKQNKACGMSKDIPHSGSKIGKFIARLICATLCVSVILSLFGCGDAASESKSTQASQAPREMVIDEPVATVIACSDFQNANGNEEGQKTVSAILSKIKESIPSADGFICAGDYDYDMSIYIGQDATQEGVTALKDAVEGVYDDLSYEVFIGGNHDVCAAESIAKSGENDPKSGDYGVFVINEDDYMWCSNAGYSETYSGMSALDIVKQTASELAKYLNDKADDGFDKPIFIVSHLPLHYSMRTKNDGDGMYANYLFDVINSAAKSGLNIIYLYGHDHSNGWDDYLGGAAVFLKKGDSINIAQESKLEFKAETLEFTYLNAGFVGYYENHNGADDALTMTVFEIYNDRVQISRYDENGLHDLKSSGVHNAYKGETDDDYLADTTSVAGTCVVELSTEIKTPAVADDLLPQQAEQTDAAA